MTFNLIPCEVEELLANKKQFQFSYELGSGPKIYPVSKYTQVPNCQYEPDSITYNSVPEIDLDLND